jgi:lysophospholipase L1-like esterase
MVSPPSSHPESGPPDLPGVPRGDAPGADPPVPEPPRGPRRRARDALIVVFLSVVVLVLFEGSSVRQAGDDLQPGLERDVVRAVGEPAGWLADRLPFDEWGDDALAFLEDEGSGDSGGFGDARRADAGAVPAVPPDSFDPAELGAKAEPPRVLDKLLVTGDSLAMPLDVEMARRLAESDEQVDVERDAHVGTGISKTGLLDWGRLSTQHVSEREPDATVVFIGANEGFPMPGANDDELECCGPEWAAEYAYRVRRMMNTYRQRGDARVYWLTLPLPRDRDFQEVARSVNAAIRVAAQPYRAQVRVLDMTALFTPSGYRDAMEVDGRRQVVRDPDGIHLNPRGAELAADVVLEAIRRDFGED